MRTILRCVAERLSRRVVLRRRMPERFGGETIYVTPDSALSFWRFDLRKVHGAKALFDWADRLVRPGDVVWDVGGNVGLFAFAAAGRAGPRGHVVVIEPDAFLVELLQRSADVGSPRRAKVSLAPVAISESVGMLRLHVANRGRCLNHLESAEGSGQTGGTRQAMPVMAVTLDWLLERFPPPDLLKIDTEGAEKAVLQGATRMLCECGPTILCEVRPENVGAVTEILRSHDYLLYDATDTSAGPVGQAVRDTLACPEHAKAFRSRRCLESLSSGALA